MADLLEPMYALNFYSPMVADQLRSGRKSATIRLGDKSGKYKKGMVVQVLCGVRFGARERVFDAVIDKVEVKTLAELSPREIEHDNPEIRRTDEMAHFLGQLYNRDVEQDERRHGDPLLADPERPGRNTLGRRERPLLALPSDRRAEQLRRTDGLAALFAVDDRDRRERRAARRAAPAHLAAALRARLRHLGLELLEPAAGGAAADAEGDPVAEHLAPFLAQPVGGLAHAADCSLAPVTPYPKIELHVHLEGTVRPATLLEIARRNDYALPADTVEGLQELYEFRDFRHFIEVWILTTNALQTSADFRQVVVDYAAEAASHGAVYLEGIFSPAERVRRGCSWQEIYEGVCDGADAARELHGVEVRLTPDIPRGFPMDEARATVEWAARYRDRGVVGVGLGGLEAEYPPEPYEDVFRLAKSLGLGSVPHAGEVAGAASVRGALEELGADRLRHGIRAEEDPGLVRELVDRGTVLDVCPLSNLRTGAVAFACGSPAAAARRRRRPLLDLDRRPGDVRHRPDPGLRGRDLVRARPALVLRRGSRRSPLRRGDPGPAPGRGRGVRLGTESLELGKAWRSREKRSPSAR